MKSGLRLFRRHHRQGVLSPSRRSTVHSGDARHLRSLVSGAAGGSTVSRRLRRPQGPQEGADASILLMTVGTGLMTIMPSYGSVGLLAPILVVAARLLQDFRSAATSQARPRSWWSIVPIAPASSPVGNGRARVLPRSSPRLRRAAHRHDVGRRSAIMGLTHPFGFGLLIGPVGYYIRSRLPERRIPDCREAARHCATCSSTNGIGFFSPPARSSLRPFRNHADLFAVLSIRELHRRNRRFHRGAGCRRVADPGRAFVGIWVDKVGQVRIMIAAGVFILTSYPAFVLLDTQPRLPC